MTATEELRRLLDERGVEYTQMIVTKGVLFTIVTSKEHYFILVRDNDAGIEMWSQYFTPEQAIAATLGPGTCHADETDTLECVCNASDHYGAAYHIHVMECSKCGRTYEHVFGDYEHCPHCGRRIEADE